MSRDPGLPALPQEICDNIIDSAWKVDPSDTLRTCSLVSRTWLHTSRKHRFSCISLRPYIDLAAFEAIITSPLLDSTDIPHLVRDLCLDWTPYEGSWTPYEGPSSIASSFEPTTLNARLPDMFKQFTSVETLRLDHLVWSHVDAAAVIELASQAAHLHLSNLSFTYGDDMVHLLSSSPRRSSLHMQEYLSQGQMFRTSPKMIPVHREVHIGRLVTDLDLFTTVHLVMREAYVTRCAFGMTIDRVDISGDGQVLAGITSGGYWHDLIQRKQTWLKMWLDFLKLGARSRGLDEGDLPTLDIKSLRIPASTVLRRITFGSMYLNTLLDLRIFLARRMHFILDGLDPKDAIPKRCADLDHALVRLVTNGPRIDIIFDAHCPAERLADWIGAISACFPALVARGTRVGIVCTSGEDMDGERPPVAQHWWS